MSQHAVNMLAGDFGAFCNIADVLGLIRRPRSGREGEPYQPADCFRTFRAIRLLAPPTVNRGKLLGIETDYDLCRTPNQSRHKRALVTVWSQKTNGECCLFLGFSATHTRRPWAH